jgi:hypothetical protein
MLWALHCVARESDWYVRNMNFASVGIQNFQTAAVDVQLDGIKAQTTRE